MSSGKNAALVIATLIVVLLIGAIIIKKSHRFTTPNTFTPQQDLLNSASPSGETSASSSAGSKETMISVNSDGFSPSTVTIKAGETVTWINTDNTTHAVYSNPHPTHTDYPPLNSVGEIQPEQKKSFTFTQAGTYKYHDHLFPENGGTVIVQ